MATGSRLVIAPNPHCLNCFVFSVNPKILIQIPFLFTISFSLEFSNLISGEKIFEKHIWDFIHSTIDTGLFKSGIQISYSFSGIFFKIFKGNNSQEFHPQVLKVSGSLLYNSSQSICTTNFVLKIPGINITGEQGPLAKF